MTIISQAAVVILIAGIAMILTRSNRDLKRAYEEGEHFVDEWALRQEKLREYRESGKRVSGRRIAPERPDPATVENSFDMNGDMEEEIDMPDMPVEDIPARQEEREKLARPLSLIIFDENSGRTEKRTVTDIPFTIGRGNDNDLVLSDLSVARQHCRIESEEGCPVLFDCGTANGILCEGRGVRALPLKSGISFYLGSLRITAGRLGEAGEKESMEEDAV